MNALTHTLTGEHTCPMCKQPCDLLDWSTPPTSLKATTCCHEPVILDELTGLIFTPDAVEDKWVVIGGPFAFSIHRSPASAQAWIRWNQRFHPNYEMYVDPPITVKPEGEPR